jgi:hypothetical protein
VRVSICRVKDTLRIFKDAVPHCIDGDPQRDALYLAADQKYRSRPWKCVFIAIAFQFMVSSPASAMARPSPAQINLFMHTKAMLSKGCQAMASALLQIDAAHGENEVPFILAASAAHDCIGAVIRETSNRNAVQFPLWVLSTSCNSIDDFTTHNTGSLCRMVPK